MRLFVKRIEYRDRKAFLCVQIDDQGIIRAGYVRGSGIPTSATDVITDAVICNDIPSAINTAMTQFTVFVDNLIEPDSILKQFKANNFKEI